MTEFKKECLGYRMWRLGQWDLPIVLIKRWVQWVIKELNSNVQLYLVDVGWQPFCTLHHFGPFRHMKLLFLDACERSSEIKTNSLCIRFLLLQLYLFIVKCYFHNCTIILYSIKHHFITVKNILFFSYGFIF